MNASSVAVRVGLLAAATALVSCGGGGSPGTCGVVRPCGGAVTGSWKITDSCVNSAIDRAALVSVCPSIEVDDSGLKTTGSASFNGDATYTMSLVLSGAAKFKFPSSCVPHLPAVRTGATTCADLNGTDVMGSTVCTGTTSCSCTITNTDTMSTAGNYTTFGTTLEVQYTTTAGTTVKDYDYCVDNGKTLHFVSIDMTMGGPMGVVTQDVVFTKQ